MRFAGMVMRRVISSIPVLIGVTMIIFAIIHSVPGDPARALAGPSANSATVAHIRAQWGLNESVPTQYLHYLGQLVHGNLGISIETRAPVLSDIETRLPATIELALAALVIMTVLGIGLGTAAAAWHNRGPDHAARFIAILGAALPTFWLGLLLQLLFYKQLGWLPVTGRLSDGVAPPTDITGLYTVDSLITANWSVLWNAIEHLILPAFTLALLGIAGICRITRASMLEILQLDYVRAARARGIPWWTVVVRYALRNAMLPAVTVVGLMFGSLIGGALVVEWVFDWPGIGSYAANSITNVDYTAIMGVTIVFAIVYLIANLVVDMLYLALNPTLREG